MLGGPLYQLLRRSRLSGDVLELLARRIVVLSAVAWLPLLLLSLASGRAVGERVAIPFVGDFEVHVRFLVTLPLLIAAELVVQYARIPTGWAYLIVAAVAMVLGALLALLLWGAFSRSFASFNRSREELARNVAWIKTVLTYSGRAPSRQVPMSQARS